MITSFVPLAASVLLTVQHLACAASCQEGPDFSFRQGGGWGNRHMYTWRGFCQKNKAISLAATAAGCLATVLLENNIPFFPLQRARQGQIPVSALRCAAWPGRPSEVGIPQISSACGWDAVFPFTSSISCFSTDHEEAWRDIQSTQPWPGSRRFSSWGSRSRLERDVTGRWGKSQHTVRCAHTHCTHSRRSLGFAGSALFCAYSFL